MTPCYIFDIDGTLADAAHRRHHVEKRPKDWDAFFADMSLDAPIPHMVRLARILANTGANLLFVTGRPERYRLPTLDWLIKHVSGEIYPTESAAVFMRPDDDRRDDDVIKAGVLATIRAQGYEPLMAFDDRTRVVKMWRDNGVPCAQVAEGDF